MVRGQPHPGNAQAHHAGRQTAGRRGQPGSRCDREVRGEANHRRYQVTDLTPTQILDDELNMQNLDAELAAIPMDEVTRAIKDIADGRPVIVVDDADRENEGDIVFAASKATPELLAFTIRYGRGLICVPMLGPDLDRLNVPQMTSQNQEHHGTAFTISVDARHDITTGISAADRAKTIQLLASPTSSPGDLVRPGHVFPLRYAEGGVLRRRGHTEAAVDLAVLAGLPPAGVVCEVIGDDGAMLRLPALREFADEHGLALISVEQLIEYRRRTERLVTRVAETVIPNAYGEWRAYGYRSDIDGAEHLALVLGDLDEDEGEDVLVRVHSECLTGDVFGSERCDCGAQLDAAMARIAERGRGVVLYLRGHHGRGIRLLTNNPVRVDALAAHGFGVTRIPLPPLTTPHNLRYLTTKRDRLGHQLETLETQEPSAAEVS